MELKAQSAPGLERKIENEKLELNETNHRLVLQKKL